MHIFVQMEYLVILLGGNVAITSFIIREIDVYYENIKIDEEIYLSERGL